MLRVHALHSTQHHRKRVPATEAVSVMGRYTLLRRGVSAAIDLCLGMNICGDTSG